MCLENWGVEKENTLPSKHATNKAFDNGPLALHITKYTHVEQVSKNMARDIEHVARDLFRNRSAVELMKSNHPALSLSTNENPFTMNIRDSTDGAQQSSRTSIVSQSIAAMAFGSMVHSPTNNLCVSKYIGTESKTSVGHVLGPIYQKYKQLQERVLQVDVKDERFFIKVKFTHVFDQKFHCVAFGAMGWASNTFFCAHCFCRRVDDGDHLNCSLMSWEDQKRFKKNSEDHAVKILKNLWKEPIGYDDAESFLGNMTRVPEDVKKMLEGLMREKIDENFGIRHDGFLLDYVDTDFVYVETLHIQLNSVSQAFFNICQRIPSFEKSKKANDLHDKFIRMVVDLQMDSKVEYKYKKREKPNLVGGDASLFREGFVAGDENHWNLIESIWDVLLLEDGLSENGSFMAIITAWKSDLKDGRKVPAILKFILENFSTSSTNQYFYKYLVAIFALFSIFEEITSLHTNEDRLARLSKLCHVFYRFGKDTFYSNDAGVYHHLVSRVLPQQCKRFFEQTGLGYGYCSMQAPEHVNKETKFLYRYRTNRKFTEKYDALAMVMHIRLHSYLAFDLKKNHTKGQERARIKKEKLKKE